MPQTTSSYIPSQILVLLSISFFAANVGRASTPAAGLQEPPASEARRPHAALGWPAPPRLKPPRRRNNLPYARIPRRPPQHSPQLVGIRHQCRRVALSPCAHHVRRLPPRHLLHAANHLQHRMPAARAHVELIRG